MEIYMNLLIRPTGYFIPLQKLDLHGKLLPVWRTDLLNQGFIS